MGNCRSRFRVCASWDSGEFTLGNPFHCVIRKQLESIVSNYKKHSVIRVLIRKAILVFDHLIGINRKLVGINLDKQSIINMNKIKTELALNMIIGF